MRYWLWGMVGALALVPPAWGQETQPEYCEGTHDIQISWVAPVLNEDDTPVSNLGEYRVHISRNPANLDIEPTNGKRVVDDIDEPRFVTLSENERRYEIPVPVQSTRVDVDIPCDPYAGELLHVAILAVKTMDTDPPRLTSGLSTIIQARMPELDPGPESPPKPPTSVEACVIAKEGETLTVPRGTTLTLSEQLVRCEETGS